MTALRPRYGGLSHTGFCRGNQHSLDYSRELVLADWIEVVIGGGMFWPPTVKAPLLIEDVGHRFNLAEMRAALPFYGRHDEE